jgi:hypothetical protein
MIELTKGVMSMGTITVRFNDEEEKTIREIAAEQNLPPSTFLKSIVMENLGNSREDLLQRGVGRILLNQKFEHDLLLALLKKSYGEKKAAEIWNTANRKNL